jgi:glycerol-3-phosphate acyltransferase PlsY
MIWIVILIAASYLLGAIPFGVIVSSRIKGVDIRQVGSGNIGTANAIRALGPFWGGTVFIGDALKGALPVLGAKYLYTAMPSAVPANLMAVVMIAAGLASIIGHNFPIYLNFKGGKGVATSFGVFVALNPLAALSGLGVWILTVLITRYASLGSLLGAVSLPVFMYVFKSPVEFVVFGVIAAIFVFWMHRSNIGRLLKGEERKITDKAEGEGKAKEKQ